MSGPHRRVYTRTRKTGPNYWARWLQRYAPYLLGTRCCWRETSTPSCMPARTCVGRSSTPKENTGVRDESFQRFVESHRLVALNTWSSGRGHTYVQGESHTQIGYIFTFPNSSRGQAKQAKPAPLLGLGGWKKGGHIPILATVRPVRHWNLPKESRSAPLFCASSLEAAMQTWVDSQLQSTALPRTPLTQC